ncbi:hypothetical protein D3C75_1335290 [compost metagenome]
MGYPSYYLKHPIILLLMTLRDHQLQFAQLPRYPHHQRSIAAPRAFEIKAVSPLQAARSFQSQPDQANP